MPLQAVVWNLWGLGRWDKAFSWWYGQPFCVYVNPQVWQASGRRKGKQGTCNCKQVKAGNELFQRGWHRNLSWDCSLLSLFSPKFLYSLIVSTQELAAAPQILVFPLPGLTVALTPPPSWHPFLNAAVFCTAFGRFLRVGEAIFSSFHFLSSVASFTLKGVNFCGWLWRSWRPC